MKKQEFPAGLYLRIFPNYIVKYYRWGKGEKQLTEKQIENLSNLSDNSANGLLSDKSKKKLKNSINWLLVASKKKNVFVKTANKNIDFRINFITLTIPPQLEGCVNNSKFKNVLNTWLSYHRKYSNLKNYVWKLEFHKDSRLHIHLTSDTFIHYKSVRDSWNRILQRNGLLELHYSKFNNYDPNSTDIHSVQKIKNISGYICKYMAKDAGANDNFKGRIWGCNYAISDSNKCQMMIEQDKYWATMKSIEQPQIEQFEVNQGSAEEGNQFWLATIYNFHFNAWKHLIKGDIYNNFIEHIKRIRQGVSEPSQVQYSLC
jgi:hypothetical protein